MSEHSTLTSRISALRSERATIERTYRAQPYPASFRRRAVELYRQLARLELTERQIAMRLGLHVETLRRWASSASPSPAPSSTDIAPVAKPLPVTLVERPAATLLAASSPKPSRPMPAAPALTLVSPQGWRIENLDLEQVLVALERLAVCRPC